VTTTTLQLIDPALGQPLQGDGWVMIASLPEFSDEFYPPMYATNHVELVRLESVLGLTLPVVDLQQQVIVTQAVIEDGTDGPPCSPIIMDEISATSGTFEYRLSSRPEDCAPNDSYQLFVVALDREPLPDRVRLLNRLAGTELAVR
jgi:hypothetical protein